eukprot:SAG31_NODE_2940_length_4882_cov_7.133807_4_plen_69_part_00
MRKARRSRRRLLLFLPLNFFVCSVKKRFQELQESSNPPNCYYMRPKPLPTKEKPPPFKAKEACPTLLI